jgi:class 3 adenylate cyclase
MEAERKQVTVLFADMVGFTSFSERSGEEAAYTLMRSLSKLMDEAVREQGGVVRGFTGDGIMAVFGAPAVFEDAPYGTGLRGGYGGASVVAGQGQLLNSRIRNANGLSQRQLCRAGSRCPNCVLVAALPSDGLAPMFGSQGAGLKAPLGRSRLA